MRELAVVCAGYHRKGRPSVIVTRGHPRRRGDSQLKIPIFDPSSRGLILHADRRERAAKDPASSSLSLKAMNPIDAVLPATEQLIVDAERRLANAVARLTELTRNHRPTATAETIVRFKTDAVERLCKRRADLVIFAQIGQRAVH